MPDHENMFEFDPYQVLSSHEDRINKLVHHHNVQQAMFNELSQHHLALTDLIVALTKRLNDLENK